MSLSIHHIAVVVSDLARAERFYVDVLDGTTGRRWDDERGRPRSVWVTLGSGVFLALELATSAAPTRSDEAPGFHCVSLGIEPGAREAWRARLREHGVAVERESAFTLYFRDPDGNLLALSHWPTPVAS